ncbi:CHAD domain protein [Methyloligella halotolerans]|uniref:CHAD domain protein n=1 Tax=Methyloligella halotolerans TaxID=1177755 RepID=A0A1E2RZ14_9HYPH|nr:CHAD domain-containing protein [Methyloligella halotolerans]ODA67454.1 CHAD domain protein [Methyloligella halotolerans]
MGYSLDPALPVTHSVRQVALSELDGARAWLAEDDIHTGIHNARKCLKRLRSLLRLVETGLPEPQVDYLQSRLRGIGRELAPARDAQALIETLDKLALKSPKLSQGKVFGQIREWLENRRANVEARGSDPVEKASEDLDKLRPLLAKLAVFPDDFEPIRKGAKQQYRACRDAYREAFKTKSDEALHEWRKQVQRHWRQLQLLAPCWPDTLAARAEHVHSLAKKLGDDHDLANLQQLATAPAMSFGGADETERLAKRCRKDQKALRAEAKALGARLFADKPKTFIARIETRWNAAVEAAAAADKPAKRPDRQPDAPAPAEPDADRVNNVVFLDENLGAGSKAG